MMTDNEKAAAFIGWAPCIGSPCGFCSPWGRPHPKAPDMSDPRNYMKALEAVSAKGLYVHVQIYKAVGGPHFTGIWIKAEADPADCSCANDYECEHAWPKVLASAMNAEGGIAATEVLAALNDAEHPEDKP